MQRVLVALASLRLIGRISKTALWRNTMWKLERNLQRLSGGRLTAAPGLPTALLETRGARTGRRRQTAVIYFHDGEAVIIVASQAGYPGNPAWYHNARAHPEVVLGGHPFRAHVVEDETERQRQWGLADQVFPGYKHYRVDAGRHGRTIPLLRLEAESANPS
ncbi:MAG: nitroreductase/quinone reductase family protein [Thermoleophilaceae bacterium]